MTIDEQIKELQYYAGLEESPESQISETLCNLYGHTINLSANFRKALEKEIALYLKYYTANTVITQKVRTITFDSLEWK